MSFQEAQLIPVQVPTPAPCTFDELISLADEQYALYQQNPEPQAYDLAVRHYCAAFDLGPSPETRTDYVPAFFRFHHIVLSHAQLHDGDDTITMRYIDKTLELISPTHPLRPVILGLKAASHSKQYCHTKDIADLHSAVEVSRSATDTVCVGHPQRSNLLIQYGCILYSRFIALKDQEDLDLAIQQFKMVPEDCSEPVLTTAQKFLASALDSRYRLRYHIDDIDRAVEAWSAVVDKLQRQPVEYLAACTRYAMVLQARHIRKGDIADLYIALKYFEIVITRCPLGHKYYSVTSGYYAMLLINRWEQEDSIGDIDNAIELICRALSAGAEDKIRLELVSMHGYCQIARFLHFGSASDLESAVENCSVAISPETSPDAGIHAGNLSRLAFALFSRYQLQGDTTDSTRAKMYLEQARAMCPPGHPNRPTILHSYARIFGNLGRKNSNLSDLEHSIKCFYESLEACHASIRSLILRDLAMVYLHRHALNNHDPSDIDIAFSLSKTSVELQPENHAHRGINLLFHAKAVVAMHPRKNSITNTETALGILHAARNAFTSGHPVLIETYREFSKVYFMRHSITKDDTDLEEAIKYRIAAAQHSCGGSQTQLQTAIQWIEEAEKYNHPSLLEAYKSAIRILDLHLVLKPSLGLRHDIIKSQARSICVDATSCALRRQDVVGAVEVFEHSRGLFWTFLARLRTPLDELQASGPAGQDLADEFERLSRQLETPMTLGDNGEYGQRYRRIQRDWNTVVDKIRALDGFDKFLLPLSYKDLRVAATSGPVIILNASQHSCDAVILLADADPIHIAFGQATFSRITHMTSRFKEFLHQLRQFGRENLDKRILPTLLRDLWDSVVSKVVCELEPHVPKNSRIWWCPTGAFTSLPIHAAHPYRGGSPGLSDIYVSSYTPTLSALIRGRDKRSTQQRVPSFVSIGQSDSPDYPILPFVNQELDRVHQLIPESVQFTKLSGETATREAALAALRTHRFAHLACHGEQVPSKPFDSHFAMRDGHVTLLDIIHNPSGHEPEFAFLSACKTATGDADTPDEVIHLAAALQFAGVRNVVGTMWSVDDQVVIGIVERFYGRMVQEDGVFDPSRAAEALRMATKTNRVALDQRIVFIHIGI